MFEKTLTDLIRGLRANKKDEQRYIQNAIIECKKEARSQDPNIKAGAVLKLTYLAMFGQDMAWASFYTVEVMASPKFVNKRIGYMAASQGFRQDTDVLMLATNLMKKDIGSSNSSEVSIALGGIGDVVTPELARDLGHDLVSMLGHSKASVRKKAVLVMYKIFLQYPEALRSSYPKLRERLQDSDQSVVSATINVIVELSRKNPKNYLPLAPELFELLTSSSNNWMLIKIIKLFATLTPLEPRLVKKLVPPLTELIQSTSAMSLLYECINTIISGDMLNTTNSGPLAQLCISKLRTFFEQADQNLKYVGLIAFTKVIGTHPDLVGKHQDVILECIDDPDISIRMRALELVSLMPSRETLPDIVKRLVKQLLPSAGLHIPNSYRKDLVLRIIRMCSSSNYKHVEDFDWYLAVLVDLTKVALVDVGEELCNEIRNICVRVKSVREFAIPILARLLCNRDMIDSANKPESNANVLLAAAWAVGEYSKHLQHPLQVLQNVLTCSFAKLGPVVQCGYLQSIPKLYCRWTDELVTLDQASTTELILQTQKVSRTLEEFTASIDIEVQRRAVELKELFEIAEQCIEAARQAESTEVPQFFTEILPNLYRSGGDLNPIAPSAQAQLSRPTDLDLDSWIFEPTPEPSPIIEAQDDDNEPTLDDMNEDQLAIRRKARQDRNKDDPYYIQSDPSGSVDHGIDIPLELDLDSIPVVALDDEPLYIKRKKRKSRLNEPVEILTDETPDGFLTPEISRPSSVAPMTTRENSVFKVDGSRLSALNLMDEAEDDEQTAFEAYRIVSDAKAATKGQDTTSNDTATEKKKKKKKLKKESLQNSTIPTNDNIQAEIAQPSTNVTHDDDIVEVVKKKRIKKKVKQPVELM